MTLEYYTKPTMYKGWCIQYTGTSQGGISTYVAKKQDCKNIGATTIEYIKKVIDFELTNPNLIKGK